MAKKSFFRGIFGSKAEYSCCCNQEPKVEKEGMDSFDRGGLHIKILGSGCRNCEILAANTVEAVESLGLKAKLEKVTDLVAIAGYGVMSTPALVINDRVVVYGKVPKPREVVEILQRELAK